MGGPQQGAGKARCRQLTGTMRGMTLGSSSSERRPLCEESRREGMKIEMAARIVWLDSQGRR
eukprot:4066931-Prymnesium_polylepis.1